MSIIELFIIVLWFSYGVSFGFKNLIISVKDFLKCTSSPQSDLGRILDALFIVSFVIYVLIAISVIDINF